MGRPLKYLTGTAALSAIIVYCYNNVIGGNNAAVGGAALRKSSSLALSDNEFPRRLTMTEQQRVSSYCMYVMCTSEPHYSYLSLFISSQ